MESHRTDVSLGPGAVRLLLVLQIALMSTPYSNSWACPYIPMIQHICAISEHVVPPVRSVILLRYSAGCHSVALACRRSVCPFVIQLFCEREGKTSRPNNRIFCPSTKWFPQFKASSQTPAHSVFAVRVAAHSTLARYRCARWSAAPAQECEGDVAALACKCSKSHPSEI
jgi:hypothetical protein